MDTTGVARADRTVLVLADSAFTLRALVDALTANDIAVTPRLLGGHSVPDLRIGTPAAYSAVVVDEGQRAQESCDRIRAVTGSYPRTRVVAVVNDPTPRGIRELWEAGARAVVARDSPPGELQAALRAVNEGSLTLCALCARSLMPVPFSRVERPGEEAELLSSRELDVVRLLCEGRSNAEIGLELRIAESTVKSHLARVMVKWQSTDRVHVAVTAIGLGLVSAGGGSAQRAANRRKDYAHV